MFEIYLYNLYKNLDFYNIKNIENYTDFYKNKIHNMIGGTNPDLDKILELSQKLKKDMEEFKLKQIQNDKSQDNDFIKIKKDNFELIKNLIEISSQEIMLNHEKVKEDIDKLYSNNKITEMQQTIDEINKLFAELLS
jgi:hypothetical protein